MVTFQAYNKIHNEQLFFFSVYEIYCIVVFLFVQATVPLGAILGGLFAWPVADYLGRQAALIIGGVPSLIGWLLISLAVLFESKIGFFAMIFVGRSFTGFASGWNIYCVSVSFVVLHLV